MLRDMKKTRNIHGFAISAVSAGMRPRSLERRSAFRHFDVQSTVLLCVLVCCVLYGVRCGVLCRSCPLLGQGYPRHNSNDHSRYVQGFPRTLRALQSRIIKPLFAANQPKDYFTHSIWWHYEFSETCVALPVANFMWLAHQRSKDPATWKSGRCVPTHQLLTKQLRCTVQVAEVAPASLTHMTRQHDSKQLASQPTIRSQSRPHGGEMAESLSSFGRSAPR